MTIVYGSINSEGTHTDTSSTKLGAKRYATLNGYDTISVRHGYNAFIVAKKNNKGKWINKLLTNS